MSAERYALLEDALEIVTRLFSGEVVSYDGQVVSLRDARMRPLPVQRPIPIWMGGESEVVPQRMARLADGWMPHFRAGAAGQAAIDRIHGLVKAAGVQVE